MTSKDRVLAAMQRRPVDHVPCVPTFNPLSPVQRKGVWNFPWPEGASTEEILRYQLEVLGTDAMVGVGASLTRQSPEVTSRVWVEDGLLHKAYDTPAGELHASVRYNDMWPHGEDIAFYSDFNIGHFVEPWLETEADLECLRHVQVLCDDAETVAAAKEGAAWARELAGRYGVALQGHCGSGLTGAHQLFGSAELCIAMLDKPDLVDAYLEHEHRNNLRTIEVLADCGADTVRRNGFYETADFYGPEMLERFLGDRLRAEADAAHAAGMVMSYTIHTGIMPILDFLASLPMDSLFGIDIEFKGVDLDEVRDALVPSGKSLLIGPSSTFHLWNGPEPTREAVRAVFECFGKTGLILSPCVSAHSIMPWESIEAMVDEWKRLR